QPPTENETAKVPYGQRYNKIGYKCNNHHRFHIRDAAQGIGKVNLQPIAELVNQEREEESGNHAGHFRIVRKPSTYLTAKYKDDTQQHHLHTQDDVKAGIRRAAHILPVSLPLEVADTHSNRSAHAIMHDDGELRDSKHYLMRC